MATGFETLQEIERAIATVRTQEEALSEKLEADNTTRAHVMSQRAATIRELAETRIRSAIGDGVIDEADRLETDVGMILHARDEAIAGLKVSLAETQTKHDKKLAQATTAQELLERLESQLDAIGEAARVELRKHADYAADIAARDALGKQIAGAQAKSEQAEKDRVEKGKPYQDDPLFMYLWKRDYRGRTYSAHPAVRWLDGKVADFIDYHGARANYAMLNEIPVRLGEHVTRLEENHEELATRLAECEGAAIEAALPEDFANRLEDARHDQIAIDGELSALESALSDLNNQLRDYAQARDGRYKLAITTLAEFLQQDRYNELVKAARSTPEADDDEIVARIGRFNRQLESADKEAREQRAELEKLARRRQDLLKVAAEFRRKSFHRPGSVFGRRREDDDDDDFEMDDFDDLMKMVVKGALTAGEWWLRAQMNHRWRGRSGDSYRRRAGMPPFGGGWGRGRSRGGWSSGGDFKTGGGF